MINKPKVVTKPWGQELWLSDGSVMPYALKEISFNAGNRTSLQVHKYKFETNYIKSGTGTLYLSSVFFDVDRYLSNQMSADEIQDHINFMHPIELHPGIHFHVLPGHLHRVYATTDLVFIEASSTELDDVIRLQDDSNRTHGTIQAEHK